jgi:hypothetical protein
MFEDAVRRVRYSVLGQRVTPCDIANTMERTVLVVNVNEALSERVGSRVTRAAGAV